MNQNGLGFSDFRNGIITLDSPQATYYSGQVVSGKIVFELNQPLTFSAINVVYHGEANVSWTEPQTEMYSGVKRYTQVEYRGFEEYFNFVQCVCGGNGVSKLPTGPHSIAFSYQIPYTVPSSFNGSIGNVSYKVTAYLEGPPASMLREELVKIFEVIAPLDLNKDSSGDVKKPVQMEFEEFYSCCCSSQPITIGINLPVSGYCPGQSLPITIDAQNNSSTEISKIIFQLVMKERYHSRNPVSEYTTPEKVLATVKKGPIMGNTKRAYLCDMPVPDMIAPNLDNCSIIDLGYFLKATIKLSGCSDDLEDESEIYVGLIPLDITTGGSRYVHPMKHSLPLGPIPDPNTGPNFMGVPPYVSGNNGSTEFKSIATNLVSASNYTPYGSISNMSTSPVPSMDGRSGSNVPYSVPSAPYPEENPKPYEIGFKI